MAIIMAVLGTLLLTALGGALMMVTTTEATIANNFRWAGEGLFAADAALDRALEDLRTQGDWDAVTAGTVASGFTDGAAGARVLADGSTIDLGQFVNVLNCRTPSPCTAAGLTTVTADRPWGNANPVWRLYANAPLRNLLPAGAIDSAFYVMVLVADDPSRDADVLWLRAEALGPRGAHRTIEAAVSRGGTAGLHLLSWRAAR